MDGSRFQEVIRNLHLVRDGSDDVGADVPFVVESLEAAPDARPFVLDELRFRGAGVVVGGVHGGVGVDPLLHFYGAGAVVELVGYVCGLGGYVADLADEGDLFFGVVVSVAVYGDVGMLRRGGGSAWERGHAWVISTSSILNSASGCGCWASRTCFMVTGRRVSLPYVP